MDFNKYNKYIGWAIFAVSLIVYFMTMERSVSLWDCGEYIATSNKLEVGHPPGAPLFMMINRLASAFVPATSVALVVNAVSAISSAFTILFLFWTTTFIGYKLAESKVNLLGKKNADDSGEKKPLSEGQLWAVLGSGLIAALVYTFTDSFWFNAVEAEVYAMSSFFTAITFWAIYRWEKDVDKHKEGILKRNPDYWLVLIMFMIGLSIGVHLLNLLAFPAIAFVYYFKKFEKTDIKGFLLTGVVALVGLLIIQYVVIPKTPDIASGVEIYFVNSLGLPFGSGTIFFALMLIGAITFGLIYSRKRNWVNVNTGLLSLAVLYIGYSCFTMITIRSNANPPIDENNPENLVKLVQYLNREQYGDRPLFSGPQFNSVTGNAEDYGDKSSVYDKLFVVISNGKEIEGFRTKERAEQYIKENDELKGSTIEQKYYETENREKSVPVYQDGHTVLFPRMYSSDEKHIDEYKDWSDYPANPEMEEGRDFVVANYGPGRQENVYLPTAGENLRFFTQYQLNHMFFRYFMWNFSGRQNDDHNQRGDLTIGNWQTGLNFIDTELIGDQSGLPEHRASNYANNKYYLLPLILGLLGLFYHLFKNWKDWFVVLLLFLFTGVLIVFYLNQKPLEPRERDYAYAAAFYTFSIWIGLSVYAIYDLARSVDWKGLARIMVYPLGAGVFFLVVEIANSNSHALSYSVLYMSLVVAALVSLFMLLKNYLKKDSQMAMAITGLLLVVPLLMAVQNWDDHDRSGRYTPREMAKNYLRACDDQALIFTNGDNDTFPLWYVQEVEEYRTDVRIVNLSLANTDWYIDQMKRKAYDSEPLPISFEEHQFRQGGQLDVAYYPNQIVNIYLNAYQNEAQGGPAVSPDLQKAILEIAKYSPSYLKQMMQYDANGAITVPNAIRNAYNKNMDKPNRTYKLVDVLDKLKRGDWVFPHPNLRGREISYIPVVSYSVPVDKRKIIEAGIVPADKEDQIVDEIVFTTGRGHLLKADLLILELIARSDWDRPIYFAATQGKRVYLGLHDWFQLEGLVYRLVPVKSNSPYARFNIFGNVHTDKMYAAAVDNSDYDGKVAVKESWDWGNFNGDGIYADYYNRRPVSNFRLQYYALASALITEEKYEKALKTLDKSLEEFPDHKIPFDSYLSYYVQAYHNAANGLDEAGKADLASKARASATMITDQLAKYYKEDMTYFTNFRWNQFASRESADDVAYQIYQGFIVLDDLINFNKLNSDTTASSAMVTKLQSLRNANQTTFMNKLSSDYAYIQENYEDEALIEALRQMLVDNELYTNLLEMFLNSSFEKLRIQMAEMGTDMSQEEMSNVMQSLSGDAAKMYAPHTAIYLHIRQKAQQQAESQDPSAQQRGRSLLQLMQQFGL